jgi:hypothetical protein
MGPLIVLWYHQKDLNEPMCMVVNNFWTNGTKVIEFKVIFVIENSLKFTNLGFN